MAVTQRRQNWVYLFEPHTASRATQRLLKTIGGEKVGGHHDRLDNIRKIVGRNRKMDVIVTVRNPIDVLVTKWHKNNVDNNLEFNEWVKANINKPFICDPLAGIWQDGTTFCWYENLLSHLKQVFHRNSTNGGDFVLSYKPSEKTEGKRPWWTYPDKDTLNLLLGNFREFLDKFAYEFYREGGEPRMCFRHEGPRKLCKPLRWYKP
ncbi:MAG: hypothetical protein ACXAEN_20425 [Candidatus Thorarchaeota archaeon]|jgi:hypothetical protein